ncbi:STAS domain-containing protein [Pilimelia columellifera]|uniref:Anti-sigma factor antagonist n=1 Tax=Pilimelia columellifera subsp. columellifera TaxID=706583 RepID=A0ABP6ACZ8_9ACTN
MTNLTIREDRPTEGVVEIAPVGEIDMETAPDVRDVINRVLVAERPQEIRLNMRLVSFIDSVGISVLVAGFQAAGIGGAKLKVTEPSTVVHRQLWVTGLHGLFGAPAPALA